MNARAILFDRTGGPEVMELREVQVPPPAEGEVQIEHRAIGLNFVEVYFRMGLYPGAMPAGLGNEAAGVVTAVGAGVTQVKEGDRVAYGTGPVGSIGAYSTKRNVPANNVLKLPDNIAFDTAAAMMLKGLTVQYLLRRTYQVKAGETIVFHAAAGGVGLIACQWAKALGVRTIGTVSTADKAELAKAHGCDEVLISGKDNLPQNVRALTGGKGVPVVYDSVGKSTFIDSLDCLQPRGLMVSFGNASGPVDPFPLTELTKRGGLFLTRPSIVNYMTDRAELEASAAELFDMVGSGKVSIQINQRFALADAGKAHEALTGRKTTGSSVLIP
ncbi:MAG: quinone oxidoreductase [Limnobacter sp.]|nr:quinone oxidoreductase [Limnobacter sp.]